MTVRVLVADDSADARAAIGAVLARDRQFTVVGEAHDGYEALELAAARRPDLVLMDLTMPRCDGLLATRLLRRRMPEVSVVVLTVSDDPADLFEAVRSGAQGFLVKSLDPADWLEYLRQVVRGDAPVPREVAARIMEPFGLAVRPPAPIEIGLTEREAEVVRLVAQALTNREVADRLGISEQTVKNHLKHVLAKLGIRNRVGLAMYARQVGLDRE